MNVTFSHTTYEKGLAIAHIKYNSGSEQYAVVRNPDLENKCWSHAVAYCKDYLDAKQTFVETVNTTRKITALNLTLV